MGQSQAYKRRHTGRRGQMSAQEYTEFTFRWIAAARAEGEDSRGPGSREQSQSGQARHTHHAQQTEPHSTQGKRGSRGARQQGAQGQRTTLLNMRHTETSNCAIVVAWQESERGRARQGNTPAHQLVERDSREAVSFVLLSDICERRPPGQRGRA